MQSKVCCLQAFQAFGRRARADGFDVVRGQAACRPPRAARRSSSTISTRRMRCDSLRFELLQHVGQFLALDRLQHVADGAQRQRGLRVVARRDDMDRDVAGLRRRASAGRGRTGRTGRAGRHRARWRSAYIASRDASASSAVPATKRLEAHLARQVAQDAGEGLVVLDDQQDASGVGQRIAVVLDLARRRGRRRGGGTAAADRWVGGDGSRCARAAAPSPGRTSRE